LRGQTEDQSQHEPSRAQTGCRILFYFPSSRPLVRARMACVGEGPTDRGAARRPQRPASGFAAAGLRWGYAATDSSSSLADAGPGQQCGGAQWQSHAHAALLCFALYLASGQIRSVCAPFLGLPPSSPGAPRSMPCVSCVRAWGFHFFFRFLLELGPQSGKGTCYVVPWRWVLARLDGSSYAFPCLSIA
jgi:hypothetical protein